MPQKEKGLIKKYHVERIDGKPMPEGCIVLEWKDESAWPAIAIFSREVRKKGFQALADDLDNVLLSKGFVFQNP